MPDSFEQTSEAPVTPQGGSDALPAPGWYADPWSRAPYRWWDGRRWTGAVSDGWSGKSDEPAVRSNWGMGDIWLGLLIWFGVSIAAVVVLIAFGVDVVDSEADTLALMGSTVVAGLIGFFGWPVLVSYRRGQRSLAKDFHWTFAASDIGWGLLSAAGCFAGLIAISVAYERFFPDVDSAGNTEDIVSAVNSIPTFIFMFIAVAIITPITEEMFFRGLALRAIQKRFSAVPAVIGSSLIFGLLHYPGGSLAEVSLLLGALIWYGIVLGFTAVKLDRVGASIVAHIIVNGSVVISAAVDSGVF